MYKGQLFVFSGPSGAGKGTICKMILEAVDVSLSISMTTRDPRPKEVNGVSYHFISTAEFKRIIEAGGFLEYAEVYGRYYGTPKSEVLEKLEQGIDVILEIDVQGAIQIKERYPDSVLIFFLPPTMAELKERITNRKTDSEEAIKLRLSKTFSEIVQIHKYDYFVINNNLEEAVESVKSIIAVQHCRVTGDIYELIDQYKEEINALSINQ